MARRALVGLEHELDPGLFTDVSLCVSRNDCQTTATRIWCCDLNRQISPLQKVQTVSAPERIQFETELAVLDALR